MPGKLTASDLVTPGTKTWDQVLRESGYPDTVLVIDFETYFDDEYGLKEMSTIEYIMDDRYEELGVSTKIITPDQVGETLWWSGELGVNMALGAMLTKFGPSLEGCCTVAHNSMFDMSILAYRHNIHPAYMIDTFGLDRHWNARAKHHLKDIATRLGLPPKGDTMEFKGWTRRLRYVAPKGRNKYKRVPEPQHIITSGDDIKLGDYADLDVDLEWSVFKAMLPKMSIPATELPVMHETLNLYLKPCLTIDETHAEELKAKMQAEKDRAVEAAGYTEKILRSTDGFHQLLFIALTSAGDIPGRYMKYTKGHKRRNGNFGLAKTDDAREKLLNHEDKNVSDLVYGRVAAKTWPTHIGRVDSLVNQCRAAGGRLPIPLKYWGAHTGRWSGDEGINPQNMGSRGHELVSAIREVITAPNGKTLVIADLAQIEARGTAWIAGQENLLQDFRDLDANPGATEDVYTKFASLVLGISVTKDDKDNRAVGKVGILGCGYGMGDTKMSAQYGLDGDLSKQIVRTYRGINSEIVQFWRDVEEAFAYTHRYGKPCSLPRGLHFRTEPDCNVIITLPNGRELKYHEVRRQRGEWGDELALRHPMTGVWTKIWGGVLTENIVQAISRDILVEGMNRITESGTPIPMHVHDEAIAITDEGDGEAVLRKMVDFLSISPEWAPDWPVSAEGLVTNRYGGH